MSGLQCYNEKVSVKVLYRLHDKEPNPSVSTTIKLRITVITNHNILPNNNKRTATFARQTPDTSRIWSVTGDSCEEVLNPILIKPRAYYCILF